MASAGNIDGLKNQVKNGTLTILLCSDCAPKQDIRFTYYTTSGPTDDANVSQVQTVGSEAAPRYSIRPLAWV